MSRRFVNLMVEKFVGHQPASVLHRVNPWRCFYPTTQQALDAAPAANSSTIMEDARLPHAAMSFYKPLSPDNLGDSHFASLGDDIICTDQDGNTFLYDAASRAVRVMPRAHAPKYSPVSLTVGDGLYLLNKKQPGLLEDGDDHPFEALIHCRQPEYCLDDSFVEKWYWCSLPPPPPYALDGKEEHDGGSRCFYQAADGDISSYTTVGDSQIWISTKCGGTFSFDTRSGVWSMAGDWALPFYGRVEYAPELGLWFGFSSQGLQFAASDLGAASAKKPPVLQEAWDELAPPLPKRWTPVAAFLLPLGAGKFCIARMFDHLCPENRGNDYRILKSFAVFTGVEVERGSGGALRMIKHKSRRYTFGGWLAQFL